MRHKPLLDSLSAYFAADSPDSRLSALKRLNTAYQQAKDASEPETVELAPNDLNRLRALADQVGIKSVSGLLNEIATSPPLLDRMAEFLISPSIEPTSGLPEIIIRPAEPVCNLIARIGVAADAVTVILPVKHDGFNDLVKSVDYIWTGEVWRHSVDSWRKAMNLAAETGHRLLAAGFWIAPPLPEIKAMIVEESFEPEHRRKVLVISSGKYEGWFALWWSRSEDCYDAAKRITGSRYSKPYVVVPPEIYAEVEDFAVIRNFHIGPAAQVAIAKASVAIEAALLLQVTDYELETDSDDRIPDLGIPESMGIDDDLADHD